MAKGGAPEQQGGGGGDNSLDFLWIVVILVLGVVLTWYYGKAYITQAICWVRFYEISAIKYVFYWWGQFVQFMGPTILLPFPDLSTLNAWQKFAIQNIGPADFSVLAALSTDVGSYLRYPVMIILAFLIWYLLEKSPLQRFRAILNMQKLKVLEQKNWPQIIPVVKLDLTHADLNKGPWAMAMSPMLFCKKYHLLRKEKDAKGNFKISLIRGATYRILSLQLGPRWKGPEDLPMYLQALFAVFVTRIDGNKKGADKIVEQLAISTASGKMNYDGVAELITKHKNCKAVLKIIRIHAYTTTVMASLLSTSREAGVLASSEFIWLKPMDRRMWYMLNSVGRPTAVAEIAGAFAHWLAERKLGLAMAVPMVDEAVTGLENSLKEVIYKPDEDEEG